MSDLLQEYKEYYAVSAKRYAGNEKYRNAYEAEKKRSDAVSSCNELSEIQDKTSALNFPCAAGLIKDQCLIENTFFTEFKEEIRAAISARILEKIDQYSAIFDLANMSNEESTRGMREISCDESNRLFHDCWKQLDEIEIYSQAEVPSQYQNEMKEHVQKCIKSIRDAVASLEEQMSHWGPNFKHTPDVIKEYRHRRLLPYKDEHIDEQLLKYKQTINL